MANPKKAAIQDLLLRLEALEHETKSPDWTERASSLMHKAKMLTIEAVALASLLITGQEIIAHKLEIPEEKDKKEVEKEVEKEPEHDPEPLLRNLEENEVAMRAMMGDKAYDTLAATLQEAVKAKKTRTAEQRSRQKQTKAARKEIARRAIAAAVKGFEPRA